jgi:hypothetical protein
MNVMKPVPVIEFTELSGFDSRIRIDPYLSILQVALDEE